ncbi:MAG: hypothetical protein QGF67_08850 [Lentisphaeria bacterium]|nr:hypothetical protein [Lentisphaeria bacterium]
MTGRSGNVAIVSHSFEPQTESGSSARPVKNDLMSGAARGETILDADTLQGTVTHCDKHSME